MVARRRHLLRGLLAAAPVLAAALAIVALAPSGAAPRRGPASARAADPPAGGPRYRVIGCRSRPAVYRAGQARRAVAIGFDDGPWTDTAAFVRMLEREHAPATFFLIGRQITRADRPLLLRELRAGDALGDHTFNHPYLTKVRDVRAELRRTAVAIRSLTGYEPCVFRPPYGAYDHRVVATAGSLGLATVLWDVDPTDWLQPGAAAIARRVLSGVRPGAIVISHDGGGPRRQTLVAYERIIAGLRRRHFALLTVPQLLGFRPLYAPCTRACDGLGVTRAQIPAGALVVRSP
jgi:peptidoglycan/xylan/chitin deacetylase (PgdA/CDA1 family)